MDNGKQTIDSDVLFGLEERFLTNFNDYSNLQKNLRQSDEDSES